VVITLTVTDAMWRSASTLRSNHFSRHLPSGSHYRARHAFDPSAFVNFLILMTSLPFVRCALDALGPPRDLHTFSCSR
jgi:hypothetical protein